MNKKIEILDTKVVINGYEIATKEDFDKIVEENAKLKQDKEELIKFLQKQLETKIQQNAVNRKFYVDVEIKKINDFLKKLGE